jgi:signal peptidase I
MPQAGLDWEMIAMIAAAGSAAIIVWDWFVSRSGGERSDARKGILEVAWPVLFIALMGLLLKFTDFAAVLLLAAVITGLVWLYDAKWARSRRTAGEPEPVVVDMARAFFPVIVIVFLIRSFWVEPFKIPSGSMKPTLLVGDFILVNKYTYGIRLPVLNKKVVDINPIRRGDVVVFRYPSDPSVDYIKRVIGTPGDKVVYRNKRLMINGTPVPVQGGKDFYSDADVNYLRLPIYTETLDGKNHQMMVVPAQPPVDLAQVRQFAHRGNCEYNDDGFSCTVPAGHYFMMGDNRDQSSDSRYWGFVPDDHIKGRAFLVWMNFGDLKRIGNGIE